MSSPRPSWAGRVPRWKIAKLYANDAAGILDEDLIDEVGHSFLARCESILTATAAHRGNVTCPQCARVIVHDIMSRPKLIRCECAWEIAWRDYHKSYRRKQLHAGGMEPFIREFMDQFPKAQTPRRKMIAIDTLIHRLHGEALQGGGRPGAVNFIGGRPHEILAFLDTLAYGENTTPALRENLESWRKKLNKHDPHTGTDTNERDI